MTIDDENSIYVGGLPYDATEDRVRRIFDRYGQVIAVKIINDHGVGEKCYGFVTFTNPQSAVDAIKDMDGRTIDGRVVKVNEVKTRGMKSNFGRESFRRYNERVMDLGRGRERERNYDRERSRDRNSERSRDRDQNRERGYDRARDLDRTRNRLINRDISHDQVREREDHEYERERNRGEESENDLNLDQDHDRDLQRTKNYQRSGNKDKDQASKFLNNSNFNNRHIREQPSGSSQGDFKQGEEQPDFSNKKLGIDRELSCDRNSERSRDHDQDRERGYDRARDLDRRRNHFIDRDRSRDQDREMEDHEYERERNRGQEFGNNLNLDQDHDMDLRRTKNQQRSGTNDKDQTSKLMNKAYFKKFWSFILGRRIIYFNQCHSREQPSGSSQGDYNQGEEQLIFSNQKLVELQKEISDMTELAEERGHHLSKLQEKSLKLEEALTSTKKLKLHHQKQLMKLHKCFVTMKEYSGRVKSCEQELQSLVQSTILVQSTMTESAYGNDVEGILTNGET